MFYLSAMLVIAVVFAANSMKGPRSALWLGTLASLLIPIAMTKLMRSVSLDMRTIAAIVGLGLLACQPGGWFIRRFRWSDAAIGFIVLARIITEAAVDDLRPLTSLEIARTWLLPYLCGRFLLERSEDLPKLIKPFGYFALILCAAALFESITRWSPFSLIAGRAGDTGEIRMGLKRAAGPMGHPIYLGDALVLLFPMALEAARSRLMTVSSSKRWNWTSLLPWLFAASVCCTMSRGAMAALLITACVYGFFAFKRWRGLLAVCIVGLVILLMGFGSALMDWTSSLANEKRDEDSVRIITIGDQDYEYTGTRHRWLQFVVYGDYLKSAGWLGHGQNLQGVEIDEELQRYFFSMDCHYLRLHLQYGWFGTLSFVLLVLGALVNLAKVAWRGQSPASGLAGGMAGALLAISCTLFTVWFQLGFGWIFLLFIGLSANLKDIVERESNGRRARRGKRTAGKRRRGARS